MASKKQISVEYSTDFLAYMDALPDRIDTALEIVGGMVESYAKELCPVKTGNLMNSITHTPDGEGKMVIGSAVDYAPWVELGHAQTPGRYVPAIKKRLVASHVAGKPFLRPALENHLDEYKEIIEKVLDPGSSGP